MSWQAYVDDHLMCQLPGGGQLAHAAIWGQDGGVWAQVRCRPCLGAAGGPPRVPLRSACFASTSAHLRYAYHQPTRACLPSTIRVQDAGFPEVTPEEIAALVAGFNDPSKLAQVGITQLTCCIHV